MQTISYETPELVEAKFGQFVQGVSAPGQAGNNDPGTNDVP